MRALPPDPAMLPLCMTLAITPALPSDPAQPLTAPASGPSRKRRAPIFAKSAMIEVTRSRIEALPVLDEIADGILGALKSPGQRRADAAAHVAGTLGIIRQRCRHRRPALLRFFGALFHLAPGLFAGSARAPGGATGLRLIETARRHGGIVQRLRAFGSAGFLEIASRSACQLSSGAVAASPRAPACSR